MKSINKHLGQIDLKKIDFDKNKFISFIISLGRTII